MKLLRETVRRLILESQEQDEFIEWLYNVEDPSQDPTRYDHLNKGGQIGTLHKDMATQHQYTPSFSDLIKNPTKEELDGYFKLKRDIKRKWNELADHSFWQGPKMKYFHDLTYYDGGTLPDDDDDLAMGQISDADVHDISMKKFLEMYKLKGNKDEMSTWGIYQGRCRAELNYGLLLTGRVTIVHRDDAFTESRSKASSTDFKRHAPSGLPKRVPPHRATGLLFNEEDIKASIYSGVGECILDNWSIEGIVAQRNNRKFDKIQKMASSLGLPIYDKFLEEIK